MNATPKQLVASLAVGGGAYLLTKSWLVTILAAAGGFFAMADDNTTSNAVGNKRPATKHQGRVHCRNWITGQNFFIMGGDNPGCGFWARRINDDLSNAVGNNRTTRSTHTAARNQYRCEGSSGWSQWPCPAGVRTIETKSVN